MSIISIFKILDCDFKNIETSLSNKWTNEINPVDFYFILLFYLFIYLFLRKEMVRSKHGHYCFF